MNTIAVANSKSLGPPDKTTSLGAIAGTRALGPDILRAVAILLVMLLHLPAEATPLPLVGIRPYGWLGVDIFFVLSGFLIGTQLMAEAARRDSVDFKSFYLRRAFRILPAFLVVLALYTIRRRCSRPGGSSPPHSTSGSILALAVRSPRRGH